MRPESFELRINAYLSLKKLLIPSNRWGGKGVRRFENTGFDGLAAPRRYDRKARALFCGTVGPSWRPETTAYCNRGV
jgi:hypothetical protein